MFHFCIFLLLLVGSRRNWEKNPNAVITLHLVRIWQIQRQSTTRPPASAVAAEPHRPPSLSVNELFNEPDVEVMVSKFKDPYTNKGHSDYPCVKQRYKTYNKSHSINQLNHTASFVALMAAIYSTFVDDKATTYCC